MHGCPLAIGKRDRHSFSTVRLSNVSESFWVFFHMLNSMFSLENINTCMTRLSGVTSFLRLQDWYVETHDMWIANLFVSVVSFIKLSCGPLWPIPWIAMSLQPWEHFSVKKGIRAEFCIPLALLGWFLTETFHWRTHVDFEFPWSCRKVIVLLGHLETQRFRRCFGGETTSGKKEDHSKRRGVHIDNLGGISTFHAFRKNDVGIQIAKNFPWFGSLNLWRDFPPFLSFVFFCFLSSTHFFAGGGERNPRLTSHFPHARKRCRSGRWDRARWNFPVSVEGGISTPYVEIHMLDDWLVSWNSRTKTKNPTWLSQYESIKVFKRFWVI